MIELKHITKIFHTQKGDIEACHDVNLTIQNGEIFGVIGYSGAGKSTLVRIINQLEKQTSGEVVIDGEDISQLSSQALRQKRMKIGMIFQHFNLLWSRTVKRNIELPLEIAGIDKEIRKKKTKELIELVGLQGRENAYPSELSGGQKQRIAIARVILHDSEIILCNRKMSTYINALAKAGFVVEQLVEESDNKSLNAIGDVDPKTKKAKMLPISFCIKARKL